MGWGAVGFGTLAFILVGSIGPPPHGGPRGILKFGSTRLPRVGGANRPSVGQPCAWQSHIPGFAVNNARATHGRDGFRLVSDP